jgi:hypothetical protein
LDTVCTAQYGEVLFQHRDLKVNQHRARLVTRIWRERQRRQNKGEG